MKKNYIVFLLIALMCTGCSEREQKATETNVAAVSTDIQNELCNCQCSYCCGAMENEDVENTETDTTEATEIVTVPIATEETESPAQVQPMPTLPGYQTPAAPTITPTPSATEPVQSAPPEEDTPNPQEPPLADMSPLA